jgi:hypothetical protein
MACCRRLAGEGLRRTVAANLQEIPMNRSLFAIAALVSALVVTTGVSAAEKKPHYSESGHHYFWIEPPPAPRDAGCDFRDLTAVINRGDVCPAADAPLVPPLVIN